MASSPRAAHPAPAAAKPRELVTLSRLLLEVASGPAVTRADLARATGLARSTVSLHVDNLRRRGILKEERDGHSTGGRHPSRLGLNPQAGVILAADLGVTQARLAAADLDGQPLAARSKDIRIGDGPQSVLAWVDAGFQQMLAEAGRKPADVLAVACGVPGPVAHATGTVVKPPVMPGWDDYRIPSYFQPRYEAPVLVDNDVNLMAVGEHRARTGVEHMLFVKVGTGIGCGIISGGRIHRGADGAAGDIGHIRIPGNDATCTCGYVGCLEAAAGGGALATELQRNGTRVSDVGDVARLAADGDPSARRAIQVASEQIGGVLAALVNFHNPSLVVVGGSLAASDNLVAGIRSGIYGRALALGTRSLTVEASRLGNTAGTAGAIHLAQRHILSPDGLAGLRKKPKTA
ncbi:ROK family protein [Frankia sp. Cj3]|uniref:ROK family transcriptional regulator n=1 Tax=Frankia sp. Cj3 TaxID=2880976 RepID=UPI001EF50CC2|nr:ROK family protein [Frankia sp. Cj3]